MTRMFADDATELNLLGGPVLVHRGSRVAVPEGCQRPIAFLALRRSAVTRVAVASTLWPDRSAARAAGNLRSALWRLRGSGIDLVQSDDDSIKLRDGVPVDVALLEEWSLRLCSGEPAQGDLAIPSSCAQALDLLPGWYDDWVIIARERVRHRLLRGLEVLSGHLAGVGRHAEAVDAAMIAICAEPLRDTAQRALIDAHIREGNRAEALRSYLAYAELLHRELGVEPARDLAQAVGCGEALRRSSTLDPDSGSTISSSPERARWYR